MIWDFAFLLYGKEGTKCKLLQRDDDWIPEGLEKDRIYTVLKRTERGRSNPSIRVVNQEGNEDTYDMGHFQCVNEEQRNELRGTAIEKSLSKYLSKRNAKE